ncbi:MAG TPA: DNA mismatch endonuclease Vsr [Candidatus Binatia bacterium]|nr:DNA mismatch endonuclease Vsr [Candidatus Binatia bacterium]
MADIVSSDVRSRMMSGIRAVNTKPELRIRRLLHARGFRYRLHDRSLPGTPDIVLPGLRAVIFVHGCFWHRHECDLFRMPGTRRRFWEAKVNRNRAVDMAAQEALRRAGWRVALVWECAMRGRDRFTDDEMAERLDRWLTGKRRFLELPKSAAGLMRRWT